MEQAAAQSADAIGEICNMVAGHFKTKIGHEADCMLSVPIVILGSDYQVHHVPHRGEHVRIHLEFEGEPLEVILEIRK
jgi:CheY-specific phosphatase CheX